MLRKGRHPLTQRKVEQHRVLNECQEVVAQQLRGQIGGEQALSSGVCKHRDCPVGGATIVELYCNEGGAVVWRHLKRGDIQ
jgi:hypothetical protein